MPQTLCFCRAVLPFSCSPRSAQALSPGWLVIWRGFWGLAGLDLSDKPLFPKSCIASQLMLCPSFACCWPLHYLAPRIPALPPAPEHHLTSLHTAQFPPCTPFSQLTTLSMPSTTYNPPHCSTHLNLSHITPDSPSPHCLALLPSVHIISHSFTPLGITERGTRGIFTHEDCANPAKPCTSVCEQMAHAAKGNVHSFLLHIPISQPPGQLCKEDFALPSGVIPLVVLGKLKPWWSRLAASQTGLLLGAAIEKSAGLASWLEISSAESTPASALLFLPRSLKKGADVLLWEGY